MLNDVCQQLMAIFQKEIGSGKLATLFRDEKYLRETVLSGSFVSSPLTGCSK